MSQKKSHLVKKTKKQLSRPSPRKSKEKKRIEKKGEEAMSLPRKKKKEKQ